MRFCFVLLSMIVTFLFDSKMSYESQLFEHFPELCWKAESLAMSSVHDIQIPICGVLSELTSTDCTDLIVSISCFWR